MRNSERKPVTALKQRVSVVHHSRVIEKVWRSRGGVAGMKRGVVGDSVLFHPFPFAGPADQHKKGTEIVKENSGKQALKRRPSAAKQYCFACNSYVPALTPRETSERYTANWAEFSQLVADGVIHRIHDSNGEIRICSSSIHKRQRARSDRFLILKPCGLTNLHGLSHKS